MLDVILAKEVDIYIAVTTSIFGAVLGVLLGSIFSKQGSSGNTTAISHTVNIRTINKYAANIRQHQKQEPEALMVIGGIFIFLGLTIYIFYRTAILTSLLYGEILILSLWIGVVLQSVISGKFKGMAWSIYLLYVVLFMIFYFIAIGLAFSPINPPVYFEYAEEIINKGGWTLLIRYFTMQNLPWAVLHLVGILFLFLTLWLISMSLLHMLASGARISSGSGESWIVRKTARYCKPWSNIVSLSLLLFMSGSMVSGQLLQWIQYDIPAYFNHLFNIVMYGKG